ncbi:MAG TPA: hypothetical protein VFA84_10890 [Acidimicrobiales bacterium]|nr:hypothetical protein [Acidimicrobiales bacterium]
MRWERLILTSADSVVTLRFHARLTVVVGVGPVEREGVTSELLGALAGPRPGTNLEVVLRDGRRIAVLRPGWGLGDRVIAPETGKDLTARYQSPDGHLDLLAPLGLNLADARRLLRFTAMDALAPADEQRLVTGLAGLSQAKLWAAADRLIAARASLERVSREAGMSSGDSTAIAEVEERHRAFEKAQDRCDSIRHHGIFTGVACALAGIPAVILNRLAAMPFVILAAAFTAVSALFRRKLEAARVAEDEALRAAGASSYGGFVHQRIAVLMSQQELRFRQVSGAVTEHRRAQAAWTKLVGDVDVEWALQRQSAIAAAAGQAGDEEGMRLAQALRRVQPASPRVLAELFLQRVAELESVGLTGEAMPLILDEPFEGLEPAALRWLLELLVRVGGHPQLVLLTEDPEIAEWAERQALGGDLAVVAPAPVQRSREPAGV